MLDFFFFLFFFCDFLRWLSANFTSQESVGHQAQRHSDLAVLPYTSPALRLTHQLCSMIASSSTCSATALRRYTVLAGSSAASKSAPSLQCSVLSTTTSTSVHGPPFAAVRPISTGSSSQAQEAGSSTRTAPPASTQLSPLQSPRTYLLEELARRDHPSYLAHHFYPKKLQTHYAAIRTFNVEIAGLKDSVSNELLGRMRMGWWRDAVQGAYQVGSLRDFLAPPDTPLISKPDLFDLSFVAIEPTCEASRRACTA